MIGCITLPPYGDSVNQERNGIDITKYQLVRQRRVGRGAGPHSQTQIAMRYGATDGNIGNMKAGTMERETTDTIVPTETWWGCYEDGWLGLITDDSFAHPAKMAKGLVYRIVREGLARGWWTPDTVVCDPFGGIGSTGIACSAHGLRSVSVELEERFVAMAKANFEMHRKDWTAMGYPMPEILQGDSRNLLAVVTEAGGAITSPPYITTQVKGHGNWETGHPSASSKLFRTPVGYGTTPGQIGAMKEGDVGAITSPPYEGSAEGGSRHGHSGITKRLADEGKPVGYFRYSEDTHSDNLGNTTGQTYWDAVAQVYSQLYRLLSPGSHAAIVVKCFVRDKQLVDLPGMTLALLRSIGFEPVVWIDAMLVSKAAQGSMLGDKPKRKERKSFFRRLAEAKGSPRIDAEVVLVVKKPGEKDGESMGAVTSPPFMQNITGSPPAMTHRPDGTPFGAGRSMQEGYGTTPGQIGKMREGERPL